jgi:hypothetical protein
MNLEGAYKESSRLTPVARFGRNSLGPTASCKSSRADEMSFCRACWTPCGESLGRTTLGPSASGDGCARWLAWRCWLTMLAFLVISQLSFSSGNVVCSVVATPLTPFGCFGDMACEENSLSSGMDFVLFWSARRWRKSSSSFCRFGSGGFSVQSVFVASPSPDPVAETEPLRCDWLPT